MKGKKDSPVQPIKDEEQNLNEVKKLLKKSNKDPAVKAALKIEKQPSSIEDFSHLHNTKEIGTSGGDQRASEKEIKDSPR